MTNWVYLWLGETNTENVIVGYRDPSEFFDSHRFKVRDYKLHAGMPRFTISCTDLIVSLLYDELIDRR